MNEFKEYESLDACLLCGDRSLAMLDAQASITQCTACSFKFVTPRPTQAAIADSYNTTDNYDNWMKEDRERELLWERRFSIISGLVRSGSLLDVGAGIGTFLDIARKHGFAVQGTEISDKAIAITDKRYDITLRHGAVEQQNYPDDSFDVVTLWHVLEHVPDPMSTLRECHRIVKKNGYVVIAVPNDLSLPHLINSAQKKPCYAPLRRTDEIHLSHFSPATLTRAVTRAGLREVASRLDNYLPKQTPKAKLYYMICTIMNAMVHINCYDTILSISQKR